MDERTFIISYPREGFRLGAFTCLIITCLSFLIISCSENTVISDQNNSEPDKMLAADIPNHSDILSKGNLNPGMSASTTNKAHGGPIEFATPLFGLATAPNGDILVADAGSGIVSLDGSSHIPLAGVSDMAPIGRNSMWALEGLTGSPGDDTGQALYRVSKGNKTMIADLYDFEQNNNPDGAALIDSNPFDVHSLGGRSALVADAGANDLLKTDNQGNIEVVAVFPEELVSTLNAKSLFGCPAGPPGICGLPDEIPAQAVSASVAVGPDGSYYVGELKGFPAPTGESNVWRISPDASGVLCGTDPGCEKVFDGGFTSIIDLAFDEEGDLHVVELDESSWLAVELGAGTGGTINKCDLDAGSCSEVATGIPIITAITFGKDGALWATRNSLIPGAAEVFEVE